VTKALTAIVFLTLTFAALSAALRDFDPAHVSLRVRFGPLTMSAARPL
jgi:hypothetical protein